MLATIKYSLSPTGQLTAAKQGLNCAKEQCVSVDVQGDDLNLFKIMPNGALASVKLQRGYDVILTGAQALEEWRQYKQREARVLEQALKGEIRSHYKASHGYMFYVDNEEYVINDAILENKYKQEQREKQRRREEEEREEREERVEKLREEERKRREREEALKKLREWALSQEGTERARLAAQLEIAEWERVCSDEFAATHAPAGFEPDEDSSVWKDRTNPGVEALKALAALKQECENNSLLSNPALRWIVTSDDDKFPALTVRLTTPNGRTYDYLKRL